MNRRGKTRAVLSFIAWLVISAGCGSGGGRPTDTPTSGFISISVDETFYPLVAEEVEVFHTFYKYAHIRARYTSESAAFRDLLNDSCRLIFSSRELNEEERKVFLELKIIPRTTKIATDAIALITHRENSVDELTFDQVKALFSGEIRTWNGLDPVLGQDSIKIVFDNRNSSTARFIREEITGRDTFPPNCFAVNTNPEVIDYVSQDMNSIGVIGVNWISDGDDPSSKDFLKRINVLAISSRDTSGGDYYQPYQAYIAQGFYPMTRSIYIISREARAGLGTGFAAFVAADKGQRIVLKAGLLPATMPVRIVGFK